MTATNPLASHGTNAWAATACRPTAASSPADFREHDAHAIDPSPYFDIPALEVTDARPASDEENVDITWEREPGDATRSPRSAMAAIQQYLNEIGRVPRATPEEEIALARRIELGRLALGRLHLTGGQDEPNATVLTQLIRDGQLARWRLIEANLRLVVSMARKYPRRHLDLLDLIQEGNLGLIHAVDKFEYQRGHRFSTYASWWIRHAIQRGLAEQSRSVRLPMNVLSSLTRFVHFKNELTQLLAREPSPEELAEAMGPDWTTDRVAELGRFALEPVSLDAPAMHEDGERLGAFIPGVDNPVTETSNRELKQALDHALAQLTPREATVLRLRMGLADGEERTLEEIGRHYGLTRERIRQVEREALRKLRQLEAQSPFLRDFLYT